MTEHILESKFLEILYPNGLDFSDLRLISMDLQSYGPSIQMYLEFNQIPQNIPKKWTDNFDVLKMRLEFLSFSNVNIEKWGTQNYISLSIKNDLKNTKIVELVGEECKIKFNTEFVALHEISRYLANDEFKEISKFKNLFGQ